MIIKCAKLPVTLPEYLEMQRILGLIDEKMTYVSPSTAVLLCLSALGMINLCPVTKLGWQRTAYGKVVKLEDVMQVQSQR